jgi:outer membrane protein TolC
MIRLTHLLLAALVAGFAGAPASRAELPPPSPPKPLALDWCLAVAQQSNPDIALDAAAADAAARRVRPAGALEDPRFGYAAVNLPVGSWDFDSSPMSGNQLELRQELPFPGLLGNRKAAARAAAEAASHDVADRRRRVAAAVERTWAELGFAQRALEITDSNIDLLRQLAEIAEAKYRVGTGLQQDVMRAQVELTLLLDERLRRVAMVRTREARLAALLDLPPGIAIPRTADLRDASTLPELELLLERLAETSPLLRAFAEQVEEAERAHRAVQLEGYPDVDLGIGYRLVRLPVDRGKWRERTAERSALLRRAKAARRGALAQLRDAVLSSFAALAQADGAVTLLETGLVPQARQSLESNRSGYQVDKVDFLSLIDSQVKLLDAELSLVRAVADRRAAFAALEGAVGEALR